MDKINVPEIAGNVNFWMMRTKQGVFFDEFVKHQFIAIGWNIFDAQILEMTNTKNHSEYLKSIITEMYKEKKPGFSLNKCIKFCFELKKDDIILIVGNGRIAFARVGDYYEGNKAQYTYQAEINTDKMIRLGYTDSKCPYLKRRHISVIRIIDDLDTINPYLYKAMAANMHSFSSLNNHAYSLLSSCYDIYIYRNNLTVIYRVQKEQDINAIYLSQFISHTALLISDDKVENIKVKTNINSPGDIELILKNLIDGTPVILGALTVIYFIIFGGKYKDIEFHSLVSFIKNILNRNYNKEIRRLEQENKALHNEKLKEEVKALKLENQKKLELIDLHAPDIYQSAKHLEIDTPMNVINFQEVKEEYEKYIPDDFE